MTQPGFGSKAQVKAIFQESMLQFEVAVMTPLAELCHLLATYGQGHGELLLVEVRCGSLGGKDAGHATR